MRARLLTTALSCLTLGAFAGSSLQQGAPPKPPTVAVVDVEKVLDESPQRKAELKVLEAKRQQFDARLQPQFDQIKKLRLLLPGKTAGTLEEAEAKLEIAGLETAVERRGEWYNQELARDEAAARERLYQAVNKAIAKVAKANGYEVVLRVRSVTAKAPLSARVARQDSRDVLYHANRLDISKKVVQLLQAEGAAANAAAGKANAEQGKD